MVINGYTLKAELKNANSGFSKWGFATKGGREYFIKELISPVYPVDTSVMSEEMLKKRRDFCFRFEEKFKSFYEKINSYSHGNLVRIKDFFRCGGRYYLVSEKVNASNVSMKYLSSLEEKKKLLLLKSAAHCFMDLHASGIVHFDVKPANIMIQQTRSGNYVAKLIDFDSGFVKGEKLKEDDLGGDLTYLAPETFLAMSGADVQPDEKSDIFGLGLVFHEYYTGELPEYDHKEYVYPYESVLDKGYLGINKTLIPSDVAELIAAMLSYDPAKRPAAKEVVTWLGKISSLRENSGVTYVDINYGGAHGKEIILTPSAICYRNTVHPSVASAGEYPVSYTAYQERKITRAEFDNIVNRIIATGIFNIVASCEGKYDHERIIGQSITVKYGGMFYGYFTSAEPVGIFNAVASVLSEGCVFPSVTSAPAKATTTSASGSSWFSAAGDL